jgi:hypothetical protein
MSSLPQERRDTGLIVTILVAVVLVVGGLAYAASQAGGSDGAHARPTDRAESTVRG